MRTLRHRVSDARAARRLAVLLPPAHGAPEDFEREGFAAAVRERGLALDLVFAAPELSHVTDRGVIERLHEEIVLPARATGAGVWIGGISLGGFLALSYAERHAVLLEGVCVFAPYLGSHLVTSEIERAGGVRAWSPGEAAELDEERRVWRFIQSYPAASLTLHLGLGAQDRFARRHRLMASALGPGPVDAIAGGHDWPTWRKLWENFLDARFSRGGTHGCDPR
jgi:pimeloyl-ACP methyl ester carboxylesterase